MKEWKKMVVASPKRSIMKELPWVAMAILGLFLVVSIFAPFISGHDPEKPSLPQRLKPPIFCGRGWSSSYPLGTDNLGRDIFARIIYGSRITLAIGLTALVSGAVIGTLVGICSAYTGGRLDVFVMRIVDGTLAFPSILIALLLGTTIGPGFLSVVIAIVSTLWARFARVIRGETLSLKERDFILISKIHGCSPGRIMIFHILPNVMNTAFVLITLNLGQVIIMEASLAFLGVGIPPPTPSWGQMVGEGRAYIANAWWIAMLPGVAIMLVVLAINQFGDWLRDTLDPRLRQL